MHHRLKTALQGITAVLFDVDGTLVDSNGLHAQAWAKALRRAGYPSAAKTLYDFIGKGGDKLVTEVTGLAADDPQVHILLHQRSELFVAEFAPRVRALPQAAELLQFLRDQGLQIVLATAASDPESEAILAAAGLGDLVPLRTTASDAKGSKPEPDIIQAALRLADVDASNAVMVGDTPYDIEAGKRAGVPVIGFRSGGWSDAALGGAVALLDGPAAMLNALRTVPPPPPQSRRSDPQPLIS